MQAAGAEQGSFIVCSEQRDHAAHLRLSGELDMATASVLEQWLSRAESNGNTAIVLDLEHVTFMDSSGLHSFVRAAERARRSGRTFEIVKVPAPVRRVLQITETTYLLDADPPSLSSVSVEGISKSLLEGGGVDEVAIMS
jgi:anti-anti-sigma factor